MGSHSVKEAILHAAIEVFAAVGFEGASFSQITERCGAKRSLILYHFESKETLWECATAEVVSQFMRSFEAHMQSGSPRDDRSRLHLMFASFMRSSADVPQYGHILLREGQSMSRRAESISRQFVPLASSPEFFDSPEFYRQALTGMRRALVSGAMLYVSNMGPLMELDDSLGQDVNPLADEYVEEMAGLLVAAVCRSETAEEQRA